MKHLTILPLDRQRFVAPRGGAWIETPNRKSHVDPNEVAPRGGAWIETSRMSKKKRNFTVAPRGGAWIETIWMLFCGGMPKSPLAEGRGLKQKKPTKESGNESSPLAEGRGLKRPKCRTPLDAKTSPLAEGRGLKHEQGYSKKEIAEVAPRGGAWIETSIHRRALPSLRRRPSRRGVD